jgi:hypothetical protein
MESSNSLVQKQPIAFAESIGRSVSLHTDTFSHSHDNVDIGEAQTRFEVARRSAEFYLEKYLQSSKDGPSQLDTSQDSSLGTHYNFLAAAVGSFSACYDVQIN